MQGKNTPHINWMQYIVASRVLWSQQKYPNLMSLVCSADVFSVRTLSYPAHILVNIRECKSLIPFVLIQGIHKRMVWFQKLIKTVFLALRGHNTHCPQRELSELLVRHQQFALWLQCSDSFLNGVKKTHHARIISSLPLLQRHLGTYYNTSTETVHWILVMLANIRSRTFCLLVCCQET
jgi:hypothetical protein